MCITSYIGDDFSKRNEGWPKTWPIQPQEPYFPTVPEKNAQDIAKQIMKQPGYNNYSQDIETLKNEVKELRILLEKAKEYDNDHDEPNCEIEEKITLIKNFGKIFSIDFRGIFDDEKVETIKEIEPFFVIDAIGKKLASFSSRELAEKFSTYVYNYSKTYAYIIEIINPNLENLKFIVYDSKEIIASFKDRITASQFITYFNLNEASIIEL